MLDEGSQPWRWPSLDHLEQPPREFIPEERGAPRAETAEHTERLMHEAAQQAARLVRDAHDEAGQIRRDARSEAMEQARITLDAELREVVGEQTAAFVSARTSLLRQVEEAAAERLGQLERELTRLVAMMAEKVIRRKMEVEDAVVLDVVRATVEQASGANRFTIRVSAPDEELVREATAELLAIANDAEKVEIVADDAIGKGGCIVETERGRFDARIETQMELLREGIERVTGEGTAE